MQHLRPREDERLSVAMTSCFACCETLPDPPNWKPDHPTPGRVCVSLQESVTKLDVSAFLSRLRGNGSPAAARQQHGSSSPRNASAACDVLRSAGNRQDDGGTALRRVFRWQLVGLVGMVGLVGFAMLHGDQEPATAPP